MPSIRKIILHVSLSPTTPRVNAAVYLIKEYMWAAYFFGLITGLIFGVLV